MAKVHLVKRVVGGLGLLRSVKGLVGTYFSYIRYPNCRCCVVFNV